MKVRIAEQHLRIRLGKVDLDQLEEHQTVATALHWAGQSLEFRLSLYGEPKPAVWFRGQCLHIQLPGTAAKAWMSSEQIGLAYHLHHSKQEAATLLVEKDLPCAHREDGGRP